MFKPVIEMEKVLLEEKTAYESLYRLEGEKSEAILRKDWNLIEEISREQDESMLRLERLEENREKLIEDYRVTNNLDDFSRDLTLSEIVKSMDEDSSHHILQIGIELKGLMLKIKTVVLDNETMMNDNMEFFNILLSGLKNGSSQTGYGNNGKEENSKSIGPVVIDRTA